MKITKSQLKQIIKEELSNIAEGGYMGHHDERSAEPEDWRSSPDLPEEL